MGRSSSLFAEQLLERDGRVVARDQPFPRREVGTPRHAKAAAVVLVDVHVPVRLEDGDAPSLVDVDEGERPRAGGDVVTREVAQVAVGALPGREAGQLAASGAGEDDDAVLAGDADFEVVDGLDHCGAITVTCWVSLFVTVTNAQISGSLVLKNGATVIL